MLAWYLCFKIKPGFCLLLISFRHFYMTKNVSTNQQQNRAWAKGNGYTEMNGLLRVRDS